MFSRKDLSLMYAFLVDDLFQFIICFTYSNIDYYLPHAVSTAQVDMEF